MEFSAKKLAHILDGTVDGDPTATATKFAKIEHGKPGTLCFYANPKYEQYVYTCKASILLVDKTFEPKEPVTPTLVRVENSYTAIARLLDYVAEEKRRSSKAKKSCRARWHRSTKFGKNVSVGDYAVLGRDVTIGDNTLIHPNVTIGDKAVIGSGCIIYPGVTVYPGTVIGNHVILHSGCVIGSDGFGNAPQPDGTWKKIEHLGNVVIGNDVEIGSNTTVDRAEMESTVIGNGVRIDNLCQIAHNVEIGDNTVIAAQTGIAGSTKVGRNCIIAGQVGIIGHLTIADNTTIAAQAGVIGNVRKSGQVLLGAPAFDAKQFMRAYAKFKASGRED